MPDDHFKIDLLWEPSITDGNIVGICNWRDKVLVATERYIYRMSLDVFEDFVAIQERKRDE